MNKFDADARLRSLLSATDHILAVHLEYIEELENYISHSETQRLLGEVVSAGLPEAALRPLRELLANMEARTDCFKAIRKEIEFACGNGGITQQGVSDRYRGR